MYLDNIQEKLDKMVNLKKDHNYLNYNLGQLFELTTYSGVWELKFRDKNFKMINITNDDLVVLKYFWRDEYERLSLELWYQFTREVDAFHFDIGAHTGIYTIIANLNKKENNIISLEPYYLNYSRMLSNLKLNLINVDNAFLLAASNNKGVAKFKTETHISRHTSGGSIQNEGNHQIKTIKLDDFKVGDKKIGAIKIDTEGHEYEVLQGSEDIIKKFRPNIIFEINNNSAQNCLDYLSRYNYKFFLIKDDEYKLVPMNETQKIELKKEGINCLATSFSIEDKSIIQNYV